MFNNNLVPIYEHEFLSESDSLSKSMMGSKGAPNSLNVKGALSSSSSEYFLSGKIVSLYNF